MVVLQPSAAMVVEGPTACQKAVLRRGEVTDESAHCCPQRSRVSGVAGARGYDEPQGTLLADFGLFNCAAPWCCRRLPKKRRAYSAIFAGCPLLDVELGTWGRDASSRCAAPTLRFGPSGDAPRRQVQWAFHGRKGTSGHVGREGEINKLAAVKYYI